MTSLSFLSQSSRGVSRFIDSLCTSRSIFVKSSRFFSTYDLAVIGGGPGGYVAAIKGAQEGLKTVCIEKRPTLGGVCLNVGCIPSKSLLNISHKYYDACHNFEKMGIKIENPSIDIAKMMTLKTKCVKNLTTGIEFLFKKNKVEYLKGFGALKSGNVIDVDGKQITATNIIIATGSEPAGLPGAKLNVDGKFVIESTHALSLESVPEKMIIIGAGVIGIELGSVWSRLGAKVEVIEFLDRICPGLDYDIGTKFKDILQKQGFKFHLNTRVTGTEISGDNVTVFAESVKGGEKIKLKADKVLLSVGRVPYTDGLGLEKLGVKLDRVGRIFVDEEFRIPALPSVRAIGDVIPGPMLAHKAEEDGIACIESIVKKGSGHVNYANVPSVIYTHPEVAGVGSTEQQLKEQGTKYTKSVFPLAANSRARANDEFSGMVKILTDENDKLMGGWILGENAGELIAELVLALEYGASSEDIARTCHAHPTLSEAIKEACMNASGKAIHI